MINKQQQGKKSNNCDSSGKTGFGVVVSFYSIVSEVQSGPKALPGSRFAVIFAGKLQKLHVKVFIMEQKS